MKYLLISILLFLSATALRSQDSASKDSLYTISGRVFDNIDGYPVVGAIVKIVETPLGAKAKIDGSFIIRNIPKSLNPIKATITAVGFLLKNTILDASGTNKIILTIRPCIEDPISDWCKPFKGVDNYEVGTIRKLDRWDLTKTPDAKKTK